MQALLVSKLLNNLLINLFPDITAITLAQLLVMHWAKLIHYQLDSL